MGRKMGAEGNQQQQGTGLAGGLYDFSYQEQPISLQKTPELQKTSEDNYRYSSYSSSPSGTDQHSHHYHDGDSGDPIGVVEIPEPKCGALGNCLGCNQPVDHEEVRRNTLIRRVMSVLFVQIVLIAVFVEFVSLFILFCVRRKFPLNLIVLFVFTM